MGSDPCTYLPKTTLRNPQGTFLGSLKVREVQPSTQRATSRNLSMLIRTTVRPQSQLRLTWVKNYDRQRLRYGAMPNTRKILAWNCVAKLKHWGAPSILKNFQFIFYACFLSSRPSLTRNTIFLATQLPKKNFDFFCAWYCDYGR